MEGRWTMVLGSSGELLAAQEGAATEDYEGLTPVPVVPCDDAAIERAARAVATTRRAPWEHWDEDTQALWRHHARMILRAAGETP